MPRRRLPTPMLRDGALTYEIRVRIGTKTVWRSLKTRDYDEALDRVQGTYEKARREHAHKLAIPATKPDDAVALTQPLRLSVADACDRYRDHRLTCERQSRIEYAAGGINDPVALAERYRVNLESSLKTAHACAVVHDFHHQVWFLNLLEGQGLGVVDDRPGAVMALARTGIATIREIMAADDGLNCSIYPTRVTTPNAAVAASGAPTLSTAPVLSKVSEAYIKERGGSLSLDVQIDVRAIVRALHGIVGDKPVTDYGKEDARRLKDVLLDLPANWTKR